MPLWPTIKTNTASEYQITHKRLARYFHRLPVRSVSPTQIFSYGVRTRPVRAFFGITHVWRIWVSSWLYWTSHMSAFRDTLCFYLWHPLTSSYRNAQFSLDTVSWLSKDSLGFPGFLNILLLPWLEFLKLVAVWNFGGWNTCKLGLLIFK